MAKFKFRLESLKKFRDRRLLVAKKDLIEVESRRQDLIAKKNHAEEEIRNSLGWQGSSIDAFLGSAQFVGGLMKQIENILAEITAVDAELERHRSWVAHLSKELKAVERLEEKQKQKFDEELRKKDRRFQDAWVVERWNVSGHSKDEGEELA